LRVSLITLFQLAKSLGWLKILWKLPGIFEVVAQFILEVGQFQNLTNEERRIRVITLVGTWLRGRGIPLKDAQLALLVEVVYSWVKQKRGRELKSTPLVWGRR
jgi:hypothetical protein